MKITVNENTPTSDLLAIKTGTNLSDGHLITGFVSKINIIDTDEFWLFVFNLSNGKYIEVRKIKNIC